MTTVSIGREMKMIVKKFEDIVNRKLEQYDITAVQTRVLMFLYRQSQEGVVTQKDIATFLKSKHTTVIGILNRLEKKNLVKVEIYEDNKRYRSISLTDEGVKRVLEVKEQFKAIEDKFTQILTEDEYQTFINLLSKLKEAINQ